MSAPELPQPTSEVPSLPARTPETHKGQTGHVAIIAGSQGMTGAAILSGLGALRGGAGLVRVYCPSDVQAIVAAAEPCYMTVGMRQDAHGQLVPGSSFTSTDRQWAHSIAAGPGLGQSVGVLGTVDSLIRSAECPVVLDADALNTLALAAKIIGREKPDWKEWWKGGQKHPIVITPHPGEMARLRQAAGLPELNDQDDPTRLRVACEFARHTGVTVVLKGHHTVVATADAAYVNQTGNPGMASGGMGDVLTGLIAALLAQGMCVFDAARLGVYAHGLAADQCAKRIAPVGYIARDVAAHLPAALAGATKAPIGFR